MNAQAENKTETIKVRVSPRELTSFLNAAAKAGVKVSTWLRLLGRQEAGTK